MDTDRYCVIACRVLWRELCHYASLSRNVFDFRFHEQGLHDTPDELRTRLQAAIDEVDGNGYAAILIGYGLCSNGIEGIVCRNTPLVVMRGHDCITFLLGSKERYREYFDAHPGTYWYTPGWIDDTIMPGRERYEMSLRSYIETYGEDNAKYLMEMEQQWMNNYSNAAYVDLGFADNAHYRSHTSECAQWLKWDCDMLEGDPSLIRGFLDGRWDGDAFLIVNPGETIVASHDERTIIAARRISDTDGE